MSLGIVVTFRGNVITFPYFINMKAFWEFFLKYSLMKETEAQVVLSAVWLSSVHYDVLLTSFVQSTQHSRWSTSWSFYSCSHSHLVAVILPSRNPGSSRHTCCVAEGINSSDSRPKTWTPNLGCVVGRLTPLYAAHCLCAEKLCSFNGALIIRLAIGLLHL
jgi:hypothetical protein